MTVVINERGTPRSGHSNDSIPESMSTQRIVALEFGFHEQVVDIVLRERHFENAGELVDYLDSLQISGEYKKIKERLWEEKIAEQKKQRDDLVLATKRLYTLLTCLICRRNRRNIVCLPCSHFPMCDTCANSTPTCPVCNTSIEQRIITFLS